MIKLKRLFAYFTENPYTLFAFISIGISFLWLNKNYLYIPEEFYFTAYEKLLTSNLYSWDSSVYYGLTANPVLHLLLIPNGIFYFILVELGLDKHLIQILFCAFLIYFLLFSSYKLFALFTSKHLLIFIGIALYLLNFYTKNMFFYSGKIFQMILIPLGFVTFYNYLQTRERKYLAYNFIVIFFFQGVFSNLSQAISAFFIYPLVYVYWFLTQQSKTISFFLKSILKSFPFFVILLPLIIYPFLVYYLFVKSYMQLVDVAQGFKPFYSALNLILQFRGAWWEFESFNSVLYNNWLFFYNSFPIILISYLLIITPLFMLILYLKYLKDKMAFLYWLAIFLIFSILSSGIGIFPKVFPFLYEHIPYFFMFREPWAKFMPLVIFAYSLFVVILLNRIYEAKNIQIEKQKLKRFYLFFLILILIRGLPFFNLEFFDIRNSVVKSNLIKIPSYWQEYFSWTKKNKDSYVVPYPFELQTVKYNWYSGGVGNSELPIHYLFSYNNLTYMYYQSDTQYRKILEYFYNYNDLDFVRISPVNYMLTQADTNSSKNLSFNDLTNTYFENEITANFGGVLSLYQIKELYRLPHFSIADTIICSNSGIVNLPDLLKFYKKSNRLGIFLNENNCFDALKLENNINELSLKANLENTVSAEQLWTYQDGDFTDISKQSENLVSLLIDKNIGIVDKDINNNPENLFKTSISRGSEMIDRMIKTKHNDSEALGKYAKIMENALTALEVLKSNDKHALANKLIAVYKTCLRKHFQALIDRTENAGVFQPVYKGLIDQVNNLTTDMDQALLNSTLTYKFTILKEGNYSLHFQNDKYLDNKWQEIGNTHYEKGSQETTLPFPKFSPNLLNDDFSIKDYSPLTIYKIVYSFPITEKLVLSIKENNEKEILRFNLYNSIKNLFGNEILFKSSSNASKATFKILNAEEKEIRDPLILKNVEIKQVYEPELFLNLSLVSNKTTSQDQALLSSTPNISFVKINPTKYQVKIEKAKDPYLLVFSENFHKAWKAYLRNSKDYKKTNNYPTTVEKENAKNIFLDKNTFETWGKKPISEERHLLVNGYANSWYITPEDASGKEDYELIIEFVPQRFFYIGLFISFLTLVLCLSYLSFLIIKNLWGKKS